MPRLRGDFSPREGAVGRVDDIYLYGLNYYYSHRRLVQEISLPAVLDMKW